MEINLATATYVPEIDKPTFWRYTEQRLRRGDKNKYVLEVKQTTATSEDRNTCVLEINGTTATSRRWKNSGLGDELSFAYVENLETITFSWVATTGLRVPAAQQESAKERAYSGLLDESSRLQDTSKNKIIMNLGRGGCCLNRFVIVEWGVAGGVSGVNAAMRFRSS